MLGSHFTHNYLCTPSKETFGFFKNMVYWDSNNHK
jgi:hypothetical protein